MKGLCLKKIDYHALDRLRRIGIQTFSESYLINNDPKSMESYMKKAFSIEKLKIELSNPESEFYFAELNSAVIGYLKVNSGKAQTEIKDINALEIERIYVVKKFCGNNVGQLLHEKAVEIATKKGLNYIWLGVWEKNPKAIKFYKRNGFIQFDTHTFVLGDENQTDIMMKLKLAPLLLPLD